MKVSTAKRRINKTIDELFTSLWDDFKDGYKRGYEQGRRDALNELMEYTYGMLTAEKVGLQHKIESMMDTADTPQTDCLIVDARFKAHCLNCAESGSYKCTKCDGEMYFKDTPQTEAVVKPYKPTNREILDAIENSDCPWK